MGHSCQLHIDAEVKHFTQYGDSCLLRLQLIYDYKYIPRLSGQHRCAEVSTVASQQDGTEFGTQLRQGLSVQSLHVLPKYMHVRLIGHSKFPIGMESK